MIRWVRGLAFRVRGLWRAETIHDEIDEELRFHVDLTTEDNMRRGMEPDEARREAAGGWLPTIDDFARAIVDAAADESLESGATVYVGSTS